MYCSIILLRQKTFSKTIAKPFTFTSLIRNEVRAGLTVVEKSRRGNDCKCESFLKSKLSLFRANSNIFGHKLQAQKALISQGRKLFKVILMGDAKRGNWIKATCLRQSQITSSGFLRGNFLGNYLVKRDWLFQGLTQRNSALSSYSYGRRKLRSQQHEKNQEKFGKQAQENQAFMRRKFFQEWSVTYFLSISCIKSQSSSKLIILIQRNI